MRVAAVLRSRNFRIGWTPGRLLQIASSRLAGQDWTSSANSCGLLKLSKRGGGSGGGILKGGMRRDVMPTAGLCRMNWILEVSHCFRMMAGAA
jgi:hypothetical protein